MELAQFLIDFVTFLDDGDKQCVISHVNIPPRCTPLAPASRVAPKGCAIPASPFGAGYISLDAREAWRLHLRNRAGYSSSPRLALGHDRLRSRCGSPGRSCPGSPHPCGPR